MEPSEIGKEYLAGASLRDLGRRYNVDHCKIYRQLLKEGIKPQRGIYNDKEGEIYQLHEDGHSARKIAKILGMTHPTVSKLIKRHAIAINQTNRIPEIQQWINSFNFNFTNIDGAILDNNKKFVIEYNDFTKLSDKKYYYRRMKEFRKNEISYILLFKDEWENRRDQVQDFILNKLNWCERKLFARKCELREVDKKIAVQFICNNHIQPITNPGVINFGLYNENELLGIVQLRKHHRNNIDITISRICFAAGVKIIGGFSRLVSAAIKWCKENGYNSVITWSDNRYTDGHSYIMSGFEKAEEYGPDYSYVSLKDLSRRISKQSMQKKKCGCPPEITENEFTKSIGLNRVWDCGKIKFVYRCIK